MTNQARDFLAHVAAVASIQRTSDTCMELLLTGEHHSAGLGFIHMAFVTAHVQLGCPELNADTVNKIEDIVRGQLSEALKVMIECAE